MATEEGTVKDEGKPEGELDSTDGKPDKATDADHTAEKWEKDYKELQSRFSKTTDELSGLKKQFETYGGVDKILESVAYLTDNESFKEWALKEQRRNELGIDDSDLGDEEKRALKIVQDVAAQTTESKMTPALKALEERVNAILGPLEKSYGADKVDTLLNAMDDKYGADWQSVRGDIADMIEADNPNLAKLTLDDMEDYLLKALRKTGKLNEFFKNMYKKELEAKKEKATEMPGKVADSELPKKPKSIQEAYELAKRELAEA